jgi:rod shape-determining protein MreD
MIGTALRTAIVIVVAVALQTTLFADVRLFGVSPELLVLLAALAGLVGGTTPGVWVGFAAGLAYDVALDTPFGSWGLICGLVAFAVADLHHAVADEARWIPTAFAATATSAGVVAFAVLGEVLGLDYLEPRVLRVALLVGLWSVVLAPVLLPVARWMVQPSVETRSVRVA